MLEQQYETIKTLVLEKLLSKSGKEVLPTWEKIATEEETDLIKSFCNNLKVTPKDLFAFIRNGAQFSELFCPFCGKPRGVKKGRLHVTCGEKSCVSQSRSVTNVKKYGVEHVL